MKRALFVFPACVAILLFSACSLPGKVDSDETPTAGFETQIAQTLTAISQNVLFTPSATTLPMTATDTLQPTQTSTPTLTLEPTLTSTPTRTQAPTDTKAATITPIPEPGTIEGSISGYPYGALPSLAIVAYMQEPPYNYSYWLTAPGDSYFSMTSNYLLPGKYQVVAYDADGNSGGCPSLVTVISEESATCNISDWSSSFPAKPGSVPSP
jgi:hypothetical protein